MFVHTYPVLFTCFANAIPISLGSSRYSHHLDAYVDGELLALWALDAMLIAVLVTKERGGGEYIPTVDIDIHLRLLHRCLALLNPSLSWMLR